tara:strand:+ start:2326 stop:2508 length:183 start_codon:yes stop_codon:yes gene_type:complete
VRKIKLQSYFKAFTDNPHHLAAISMLQSQMPDHLLSTDAEWVVCFQAEEECKPGFPKYNR